MKTVTTLVKIAIGLAVIVLIVLIGYQNKEYFLETNTLCFDFYINDFSYETPEIQNALFFLICFFIGSLTASFFGLYREFKSNKTINNLNNIIKSHLKEISNLESELAEYQSAAEEEVSEDTDETSDTDPMSDAESSDAIVSEPSPLDSVAKPESSGSIEDATSGQIEISEENIKKIEGDKESDSESTRDTNSKIDTN